MIDYYEPSQPLRCPVCSEPLAGWQGKDGPNALFVWREGSACPVDQKAGESNIAITRYADFTLPPRFEIYTGDCPCDFVVEAICSANGGTWNETRVVTKALAKQKPRERRTEWKKRREWLESGAD